MAIKIMSWVWENSPTKGSERLVLLALADSANDQGVCWPGMASISKKANLDRRYVIDILDNLEKAGLIKIERRRKGSLNMSNLYFIVTGVVNPASPGSEAGLTRGSEEEITRVVRPASPDPLINRNIDPSINHHDGASAQSPPAPETPPVEKNKPPKKARKSNADARTSLPSIQAIFSITGRFPRLDEYDCLIAALGESPDLPRLRECWAEWRRVGPGKKAFSPFNFGWVVDWYVNGIPDKQAAGSNFQARYEAEKIAARARVAAAKERSKISG